jgi:hypothetical protein
MMHTTEQILKKVRCMAKKILKLKNEGRHNCHEIDDLVQEAQYLEIETREYEKKDK